MATRPPKKEPEFLPDTCGACKRCTKSDGGGFLCWAEAPWYSEELATHTRAIKIESAYDPACRFFVQRLNS